jgi:hypothetical protein
MTTDGEPSLLSKTGMENFFKFFPAGTSCTVGYHFVQEIRNGKFQRRER